MAEYHTSSGKLADPEFRHRRAVDAGRARHSPDALIAALVRSAPSLTPEQAAKLRALLPAPKAGDGDD